MQGHGSRDAPAPLGLPGIGAQSLHGAGQHAALLLHERLQRGAVAEAALWKLRYRHRHRPAARTRASVHAQDAATVYKSMQRAAGSKV